MIHSWYVLTGSFESHLHPYLSLLGWCLSLTSKQKKKIIIVIMQTKEKFITFADYNEITVSEYAIIMKHGEKIIRKREPSPEHDLMQIRLSLKFKFLASDIIKFYSQCFDDTFK